MERSKKEKNSMKRVKASSVILAGLLASVMSAMPAFGQEAGGMEEAQDVAASQEVVNFDESWQWAEGPIRFSEIYDGETADARITPENWEPVLPLDWSRDCLIPQEGEPIREAERIAARRVFKTPDGDTVVDFGQEVTGWVEFTLEAKAGEEVLFDHAEVLGPDGSWYNENYRSAKSRVRYVCRDGRQTWHPRLTFFGFRMIRLISWPGEASPEQFTAVAVHSDLRRTGWLKSGDPLLNRFFSNVVWGQLGNFLDVPTDCPQRDERLGWTGDAEAFVRAAACFYDVERFFRKWLRDLRADQRPDGGVGSVIPDVLPGDQPAAAWGDAAAIVPWEIYQAYGCLDLLADQFDSMVRWVRAIPGYTKTPDLWTDWPQFADWLGLDAPEGSYTAEFAVSHDMPFIACATSADMPPFPMIARILNFLMNSGSNLFILALVVGPAARTTHPPSTFCIMGPQWYRVAPVSALGISPPSFALSRARMWSSSRPVTIGPLTLRTCPIFSFLTSLSLSGSVR